MMASPFSMASSPFADMIFEPFEEIDYKKEELKRYVRNKAYLPPLDRFRSIPATINKKRHSMFSDETGILFGKQRRVSFCDDVQTWLY